MSMYANDFTGTTLTQANLALAIDAMRESEPLGVRPDTRVVSPTFITEWISASIKAAEHSLKRAAKLACSSRSPYSSRFDQRQRQIAVGGRSYHGSHAAPLRSRCSRHYTLLSRGHCLSA